MYMIPWVIHFTPVSGVSGLLILRFMLLFNFPFFAQPPPSAHSIYTPLEFVLLLLLLLSGFCKTFSPFSLVSCGFSSIILFFSTTINKITSSSSSSKRKGVKSRQVGKKQERKLLQEYFFTSYLLQKCTSRLSATTTTTTAIKTLCILLLAHKPPW